MSRRLLMLWALALVLSISSIVWPDSVEVKEGTLAKVTGISGNVHIRPTGSFSWTEAQVGSALRALDAIATGPRSRATLRLENGDVIHLPEDTQIKIQAQTVVPGMTISLIKGTMEVQAEPRVITAKALTKRPLQIQTRQYNVDLSRLEGGIRLGAAAGAEAAKPETVRVENAKGVISLARLEPKDTESLADQIATVMQVNAPLPAEEPQFEETIEEPPPPPPPRQAPVPVPVPSPETLPVETPEPVPLVPVEEEVDESEAPRFRDSQLSFWTAMSIDEAGEFPLVIAAARSKAGFDRERWQSALRIGVKGSNARVTLKREPGSDGFFFYLNELNGVVPTKNFDGLELQVESGLVKRGDEASAWQRPGNSITVDLHSLLNQKPATVRLDRWRFVEPNEQWIHTGPLREADHNLHVLEPKILTQLEGYVRGAKSFAIEPLSEAARTAPIHFVVGKSIVLAIDAQDEKFIQSLVRKLKADLVFRGSAQAFLGGKGSFDINQEHNREGDLFYVRQNRVLKMDRGLFKTHSAARSFIRAFDPYFFSKPVDVLYTKD